MKTLNILKQKNKILSDFYVFDTETNGLRAKSDAFIFGVVYGNDYINVIYTVENFKKEFLKPRYKNKKVFAHNAEYDLSVIYDNIYDFDKHAIFNNKFICATNGNCMFADSMNIFQTSVKKIGEMIGFEKMELSQEYKEGNFGGIITRQMVEYCQRDCEIVYQALFNFFELVGSIKITVAGLAMCYYRAYYQPFNIDFNEDLGKYFYDSYYGGRTEAFYIGKINPPAVVYDINSMYADAMYHVIFPNPKYLQIQRFCKVELFVNYHLKNYEGCAEITVNHLPAKYGFLPYKKDGKLLFPIGNLRGTWNFNEIRYALKMQAIIIKKVHSIIFAPALESPFKQYVNDLYNKRISVTNPLHQEIYKKLLTNLYGKFAQRIKSEQIYIDDIIKQFNIVAEYQRTKQLIKIHPFAGDRKDCFIEIKSQRGELYHSIPLFSSYITSYARVKLLSEILRYDKYKPLYCDTDSIFFRKNPKINNSELLGGWKCEKKTVYEIHGLKNYSYLSDANKKIETIKGIPGNAVKIGEMYHYKTLIKTKEALRRRLKSGILTDRIKVLSLKYDKRIVLKDGNTEPICLI